MIFGRGGAGGVINRVTKQAQWTPVAETSLTLGSWNNRRLTADVGRALDQKLRLPCNGDGRKFRELSQWLQPQSCWYQSPLAIHLQVTIPAWYWL